MEFTAAQFDFFYIKKGKIKEIQIQELIPLSR